MAEKDATQKILESYNDVFADIVNVLLFNGREVLKPEELVDQAPRAAYKADDKIHEIERDVAKRWIKQNIRIACVGLENQTDIDPDMPFRVIGYDGAEYRYELSAKTPDGKKYLKDRYPVVTLVLYFGHKKRWDQPLNLLGCLDVPEEFKPYVNDYKINLFEIAYLTDEQVNLFKSDFRVVADYFVQMRKNNNYKADPRDLDHMRETMQLLSAMTHDHRYEEACNNLEEGAPKNMCEVLDRIERNGEIKGIALGEEKANKASALNMYADGVPIDKIAKYLNCAVDSVKKWVGLMPA